MSRVHPFFCGLLIPVFFPPSHFGFSSAIFFIFRGDCFDFFNPFLLRHSFAPMHPLRSVDAFTVLFDFVFFRIFRFVIFSSCVIFQMDHFLVSTPFPFFVISYCHGSQRSGSEFSGSLFKSPRATVDSLLGTLRTIFIIRFSRPPPSSRFFARRCRSVI